MNLVISNFVGKENFELGHFDLYIPSQKKLEKINELGTTELRTSSELFFTLDQVLGSYETINQANQVLRVRWSAAESVKIGR